MQTEASMPPKPLMFIAYSPHFHKIKKIPPISAKFINFPTIFVQFMFFYLIYAFWLPSILIIMHLSIYALHVGYWTPRYNAV